MEKSGEKLGLKDLLDGAQEFDAKSMAPLVAATKEKFENPNADTAPFSVPGFKDYVAFLSFLMALAADDWCTENLIIVLFDGTEGRLMGIGHKKDRHVWEGVEGQRHLRSRDIATYEVFDYASRVFSAYQQEQGGGIH